MSLPSETHQKSSLDQQRNKKYLRLIFEHSESVIDEVLKSTNENYAHAYDELVRKEGHGTPGAVRRSVEFVPRMPLLPRTRRNLIATDVMSQGEIRIKRAEQLIESFEKRESSLTEYWKTVWGDEYRGFRDAQKEIGVLRDDIVKGKFKEGISRYTLQHLRNKLNFMLRSSVGEWYKKWGELDLHRLSTRDALEVVRNHLKQPPWSEMRIVAGQRPHVGDDHNSEGILFNLIHCMFGKVSSTAMHDYNDDQVNIIRDIQRYAKANQIKLWFYSNNAAVYLWKPRRAHRVGSPVFTGRRSGLTGLRSLDLSRR